MSVLLFFQTENSHFTMGRKVDFKTKEKKGPGKKTKKQSEPEFFNAKFKVVYPSA